jgi:hypothetical protein
MVKVKSGAQQLHLRKIDRVWEMAWKTYGDKRRCFREMLQKIWDGGFLQDSEYAFLWSEDLIQMEDRVWAPGPLRGRTFFVSGAMPTLTQGQLAGILRSYGGKLIRHTKVDGPDVIAIGAPGGLDLERGALRYWQPATMSEAELLNWLEFLRSREMTLPMPPGNESSGPGKRKREEETGPLADRLDLPGSREQGATSKVRIIDLCS